MSGLSEQMLSKRVTFYLSPSEETESSEMMLGGTAVIVLMSLVAIPLTFCLNTQEWIHDSFVILVVGIFVLCLILFIPYLSLRKMKNCDPVLYVSSLFMFSSAVNIVIALENDDIIADFVTFYLKDGEPQLKTAHGTMLSYWDGLIHYGVWLMILAAISWGEDYHSAGLFWVGSFTNSILVFLPGSIVGLMEFQVGGWVVRRCHVSFVTQGVQLILADSWARPAILVAGKFGVSYAMILSLPYLVLPLWIGHRLLTRERNTNDLHQESETTEPCKHIWKRPLDLLFIVYFVFAGAVDLFRGFVALGCQEKMTVDYVQQFEPYLSDPTAYPKIQMLIYMFYFVPYYICAVYGLINPHQAWTRDWSLLYAGAAAQGQFTHIGSSLHSRTPFKLRVPSSTEACIAFWVVNGSLFLVPQLFAYRQNAQEENTSSQNGEKTE